MATIVCTTAPLTGPWKVCAADADPVPPPTDNPAPPAGDSAPPANTGASPEASPTPSPVAAEPTALGAPVPDGIEVTYESSEKTTWYNPASDPWRMFDFWIYPGIASREGGTRKMVVMILVKDPPKGLPTSLQVDTGEETWIVPITDSERVQIHDSGCRVTQTIALENQASFVQTLADAAKVKLTLMGYERPVRYELTTEDQANFRRLAALWKSPVLPPVPPKPGCCISPAGSVAAVKGLVTNPELIRSSKFQPDFPRFAMGKRAYGKVELGAVVRKDGTVGDIEVLKGAGGDCGFEEAAINAVRRWRYKPGTIGGQPIDVYFTVEIDFLYRR